MGRLPAVVNIARHGARLDAADSQWHLTSPTPYDTPLTYGGWLQSRTLGARIASLLETYHISGSGDGTRANGEAHHDHLSTVSEDDSVSSAGHDGYADEQSQRRRASRQQPRIIIHTSPYLRCVQTSIAISAGLAQYHGAPLSSHGPVPPKPSHLHSGSPRLKAAGTSDSPHLAPIPEPSEDPPQETVEKQQHESPFRKPLLRVDAFLGEWLNPDYYDMITPPPSSVMMVAGAKADLLRSGDYDDLTSQSTRKASTGFPGGWGSAAETSEGPLSSMSSMGHALPRRERASSHSSSSSTSSRNGAKALKSRSGASHEGGGYAPLIPSYAISPSDPIPRGYVEHARDACVEVDYQWDSMREPQNWGTGGEYGEEWGAMHKRYRTAIQKMLSWYRDHGDASVSPKAAKEGASTSTSHDHDDPDAGPETVLILVSHGAGCNAIIGGLTDRTVLLDVGMASLTMAVRKDATAMHSSVESLNGDSATDARRFTRRTSSVSIPVSEDYEIKLMASTDHLRPSATGSLMNPPPLSTSQSFAGGGLHRNRSAAAANRTNSMDEVFTIGEPRHATTSSAIGSIRRTTSQRSSSPLAPHQSFTSSSPVTSSFSGLWNRPPASETIEYDEDGSGDDMVLNFGDSGRTTTTSTTTTTAAKGAADEHVKVVAAKDDEKAKMKMRGGSKPTPPPIPSTAMGTGTGPNFVPRTEPRRGLWGSSAVAEERKERDETKPPKRRWTVHERAR